MLVSWRREGIHIEAETDEERQFLVHCFEYLDSTDINFRIKRRPLPVFRPGRQSGIIRPDEPLDMAE